RVDLQQTSVQAYPNPFVDYLIVKSDKTQSLKLFSLSGQCLINTTVFEGDNRINAQTLPKGSYILQCGNEVVKLIK
ncbi:MAG: T9SS type A sorting domain-containing protein, partial [Paludibacteraceae bacterium]